MQDWAAWGVFWGDSWGNSWGPLHEVAVIAPSPVGAGLYHVSQRRQRGFKRLRPMPAPAVRRRDDTIALLLAGVI